MQNARTDTGDTIAGVVFGLFFLAGGFASSIFGALSIYRAYESRGWPGVPGVVVSSKVVRISGSRSRRSGPRRTSRAAAVEYRYVVGDQEHVGRRISFAGTPAGDGARDVVRRYPRGADVTVYYDPDDPSSSVLEVGMVSVAPWILIGIGLPFAFIGLAAVIWVVRSGGRKEQGG